MQPTKIENTVEICRNCGSGRTVRNGTAVITTRYIAGGLIAERETPVARMRCRTCEVSFTIHDPRAVDAERQVRDHVVDLVFAMGQSGAAKECGLSRAAVQRYARKWDEARQSDVDDAAPEFLLLDGGTIRALGCLLLVDLDRESLVEMLAGATELNRWLTRAGRKAATQVCVPMNAELAAVVRRALPDATLLLAPAVVRRAIHIGSLKRLRAIRRDPDMRGRNALPRRDEFMGVLERGVGDTDGWPDQALSLLSAARCALALLDCKDKQSAEKLWPEFMIASSVAGAEHIAMMFHVWRNEILDGLDHQFIDKTTMLVEQIRRRMALRRPPLGLADMRCFAVLRDFRRATEPRPGFSSDAPYTVAVGSSLHDLLQTLAA